MDDALPGPDCGAQRGEGASRLCFGVIMRNLIDEETPAKVSPFKNYRNACCLVNENR